MKIGILTWYQSINHGAVLQAYALSKVISGLNYDIQLVDYKRQVTPVPLYVRLKNLFKRFFDGTIIYRNKWIRFDAVKADKLSDFVKKSLDIGPDYSSSEYDLLIIGSDMVFDLRQGYNPYMFGIGVKSKRIISYAASSGGEKSESLLNKRGIRNEVSNGINSFSAVGVRDTETYSFVKELNYQGKIAYNLDPVLLYGFEKEIVEWGAPIIKAPYLLIYSYHGNMDRMNEVKAIKKIASNNNLSIVSCGYYHNWCDISINASPEEFISLFHNASYVITDTFHGTVFSLLFNREFCTLLRNNSFKVEDLLTRCGLNNRIVNKANDIGTVLNKSCDFDYFNKWLINEKSNSLTYLLNNIIN